MLRHLTALSLLSLLSLPAFAEDGDLTPTPVTTALSQRFMLIVLDQPDRDLLKGDPKISMMFDTQTGRSWILEYGAKPGSNQQGYIWSEVPYAKPPTN